MKIGPFNEKELKAHLQKIPISEIKKYNDQRMEKYRILTRIAYVLRILAIIVFFVHYWLTIIIAVIGIIIITYTLFQRSRWRNLYENFMYFKKKGDREVRREKENQKNDKYTRAKHRYKKKSDTKKSKTDNQPSEN